MERLTENVGNGVQLKECGNSICMAICNSKRDCFACPIDEAFRKLAAYEDAEEQGLLVRLPCKFGDTVWELCQCEDGIYRIFPMTVKAVSEFGTLRQTEGMPTVWNIYAESDYTYSYKTFGDIGKSVFLTREEAEKKLEEMKNGH